MVNEINENMTDSAYFFAFDDWDDYETNIPYGLKTLIEKKCTYKQSHQRNFNS